MNGEFYVGYRPKAPPGLARWVAKVIAVGCAVGIGMAVLLLVAQQPFAASRFEYQQYRDYGGWIEEWPYPALVTRDSRYLLVLPGKHGAAPAVMGLEGKSFRLQGALIRQDDDQMLELQPGSLLPDPSASGRIQPQPADLGAVSLTGEIVDSKCYLGVMNPGNGHTHRDCAVRCISGGIPPAFRVTDGSGRTRFLLLTGADGRALRREVLDWVAEPVVITGRLIRSGEALILRAEPAGYRRFSGE